jgi:hypothetical protein
MTLLVVVKKGKETLMLASMLALPHDLHVGFF